MLTKLTTTPHIQLYFFNPFLIGENISKPVIYLCFWRGQITSHPLLQLGAHFLILFHIHCGKRVENSLWIVVKNTQKLVRNLYNFMPLLRINHDPTLARLVYIFWLDGFWYTERNVHGIDETNRPLSSSVFDYFTFEEIGFTRHTELLPMGWRLL